MLRGSEAGGGGVRGFCYYTILRFRTKTIELVTLATMTYQIVTDLSS